MKIVVDGEPCYLNDTDEYAQLGTTTHDGRLGVVLANHAMRGNPRGEKIAGQDGNGVPAFSGE